MRECEVSFTTEVGGFETIHEARENAIDTTLKLGASIGGGNITETGIHMDGMENLLAMEYVLKTQKQIMEFV